MRLYVIRALRDVAQCALSSIVFVIFVICFAGYILTECALLRNHLQPPVDNIYYCNPCYASEKKMIADLFRLYIEMMRKDPDAVF